MLLKALNTIANLVPSKHRIRIFWIHRPVSYLIKLKLILKSYNLNNSIKIKLLKILNVLSFLGNIILTENKLKICCKYLFTPPETLWKMQ